MQASDLVSVVDLEADRVCPTLELLGEINGPDADSDGPRHLMIESENYRALQLLGLTHAGQVDCIYIDPPYNTGNEDWAYNDKLVGEADSYRHSKWLAMMSRRLRIARRLLKRDGVLIVMIDEHELHRLALLLEQMFPSARHQMVTIVTKPNSTSNSVFARVEEHALFCFLAGDSARINKSVDDLLKCPADQGNRPPEPKPVTWNPTKKTGSNSRPSERPGLVYPVGIDSDGNVVGTGRTLAERCDAGEVANNSSSLNGFEPDEQQDRRELPGAASVVWPYSGDSTLRCWVLKPETLERYASLRRVRSVSGGKSFEHLSDNQMELIDEGVLRVDPSDDGSGPLRLLPAFWPGEVRTVWYRTRHNLAVGGSKILDALLGERRFQYPKSVYSTLDALAAVISDRPDAVVLDFFAGSGTTLHAVALLNLADGGRRRCVLVTNNEVDKETQRSLSKRGIAKGSPEWEAHGVFRRVTRPRVEAALSGRTPQGKPVQGKYLPVPFGPQLDPGHQPKVHGRQISQGLPQSAVLARLVSVDPQRLAAGDAFDDIHPLLWAASGGRGPCPTETVGDSEALRLHEPGWLLPGSKVPRGCWYGVLLRPSRLGGFANALGEHQEVSHVFVNAADRDELRHVDERLSSIRPGIVVGWLFEDLYRRIDRGGLA